MEWKNLSAKLKDFSLKTEEALQVAKTKGVEYWGQASEFTLTKMRQSSICIKNSDELDVFLRQPVGVLFCIDETDSVSKQMLLKAPVLLAQNLQHPICIRIIEKVLSASVLQILEISQFPSILIYKEGKKIDTLSQDASLGEITRRLSDIQS